MIKRLFNGLLVLLAALFISYPAAAQEVLPSTLHNTEEPATLEQPALIETNSIWLDGRASLMGGLITTSAQQFEYAKRIRLIPVTSSNFSQLVGNGYLVRLESPNIRLKSAKVIPYVLPSTKIFVLKLADDFYQAGCGKLVITSALRLADRPMPKNASPFSVHPTGMAVDARVNGLSPYCRGWISTYLLNQESARLVDATEELVFPHFHAVVPPPIETNLILLASNR